MIVRACFAALVIAAQFSCALASQGADEKNAAEQNAAGHRPLYVTAEGVWQVFYLPKPWMQEHLASPGAKRAYVRLDSVASEDALQLMSDCAPPQRIVIGVVEQDDSIRERTLACLELCGPAQKELWGRFTFLQGLTARILANGSIELIEHYRKRVFTTTAKVEDINVVEKTVFQEDPKQRRRVIEASAFDFEKQDAKTCYEIDIEDVGPF